MKLLSVEMARIGAIVRMDEVFPLSFDVLSKQIGKAIEATYGKAYPVEVSTVGFNYDRTSILEEMKQLSEFIIERQVDKTFSSNRFYCSAPLSTRDHIALLEQLENELGK